MIFRMGRLFFGSSRITFYGAGPVDLVRLLRSDL